MSDARCYDNEVANLHGNAFAGLLSWRNSTVMREKRLIVSNLNKAIVLCSSIHIYICTAIFLIRRTQIQYFMQLIHSQKSCVICSFAYLRWRRRGVCNFHMICIDDNIPNCMCVIF